MNHNHAKQRSALNSELRELKSLTIPISRGCFLMRQKLDIEMKDASINMYEQIGHTFFMQ